MAPLKSDVSWWGSPRGEAEGRTEQANTFYSSAQQPLFHSPSDATLRTVKREGKRERRLEERDRDKEPPGGGGGEEGAGEHVLLI